MWITKKKIKFNKENYPKLIFEENLKNEVLIISNHVNDFDNLVHSIYGSRGFLSKHNFKDKLIFGKLAQI